FFLEDCFMRFRNYVALALAAIGLVVYGAGSNRLSADGAAAVTGEVTSQQESKMEGVVVSARRDGANFTVSVVIDDKGKYSFPRTHLEPGSYKIAIRAAGYDLADAGAVTVAAGKTATADLQLTKTKDLAAQL